ncbi:MAG TPA: phosphoribosylanthranilate isomerase [Verrucomicrobiae bacterium]|nr:phosphoribosylanthranilate isomerase [Verrucomicrobiae bacterium]
MIVKICGITNVEDARAAAEAGADILGFIFHERSSRHVTPAQVAAITRELPAHVVRAGVFVNPAEEFVFEAISSCGLNLLQFHGAESAEFCVRFGLMTMKAFPMRDAAALARLPEYKTDAWLLDAYSASQAGGTGETFNWDLAVRAREFGRPIFLAGGLTPENVAEAILKVRPYAVDVSSGVEASPGRKDHQKVKAFIKAAKQAFSASV